MNNEFRRELESLINRHSQENNSNTPDFILAQYLESCLAAFDYAVSERERWYGRVPAELDTTLFPLEDDALSTPKPADGLPDDPDDELECGSCGAALETITSACPRGCFMVDLDANLLITDMDDVSIHEPISPPIFSFADEAVKCECGIDGKICGLQFSHDPFTRAWMRCTNNVGDGTACSHSRACHKEQDNG